MMPDGNACVLTSSNERGGVPSAKKRFPVPNRTGLMRRMPSTMSGPRPSDGPHSRLAGRWVATTAKQQIEALAIRGKNCIPASGSPIGRRPVTVGEIAVVGGALDHAIQRNVSHDFELSNL